MKSLIGNTIFGAVCSLPALAVFWVSYVSTKALMQVIA